MFTRSYKIMKCEKILQIILSVSRDDREHSGLEMGRVVVASKRSQ